VSSSPASRDIALEAGFSDQSHLTRVFRALTGMTPATYRQRRRS
jgi:AraC-like DNA-binding protein